MSLAKRLAGQSPSGGACALRPPVPRDYSATAPSLLVNDESVTQLDYLSAIARELGVAVPTRRIPYRLGVMLGAGLEIGSRMARRRQPPPLMRYGIQLLGGENRFSIERARRELGLSPQVPLAEGVRRSVEWYRTTSMSTSGR